MAVPQFDVVVDALVATLQAYSGLSAPGGTGVPVYDGPIVTDEPVQAYVAVGWDGNDEISGPQIRTSSEFHAFGGSVPPDQMEDIDIDCYLAVQDGGSDFSTLRTTASTYLGYVSSAVRATPTLGSPQVLWAKLDAPDVMQGVSANGALVEVSFLVRVRTLI